LTSFAVEKRLRFRALLSGKKQSTEMPRSNAVAMLKLSLKFNVPESVVPANISGLQQAV